MGSTSKGVPIMPALVPQLEYLRTYSPVPIRIEGRQLKVGRGVSSGILEVLKTILRVSSVEISLDFATQIEHIRRGHHNAPYADRFTACIPCCLDHIKWDVVYNYQTPDLPPDVVFGADDQDFQPLLFVGDDNAAAQAAALGAWTILRDWTAKDYSRLLRFLLELRSLYLRHQRKRVEFVEDPRVRFEIGTISAMEGLEMRIFTGADRSEEVQFAIPLDIDLTQISRRLGTSSAKLWSGISLQVAFSLQRGQTFTGEKAPQLRLHAPPAMRDVFDVEDVKLPTWADRIYCDKKTTIAPYIGYPRMESIDLLLVGFMHVIGLGLCTDKKPVKMLRCLMEYVPNVQDILKAQVREAITSVGMRRSFLEALGPVFGRPLELETNLFRRVSIMVTSGLFCFLIHFSLPTQFPKQQPTLTFQSSQVKVIDESISYLWS
ncbi:hypothetical protein AXG93_815s1050 [Marchantia polymorpha subsp. ruderalis]|uniref:BRISC and BRCA1-A complex member 2 n=1 Tax=Marchantia polymorpha subsp. ruderalis TaxID=1480154 RepID=A0A176W053_MARPO|nr:hypothetical protein AXG93_815s1050 [Marchantia polymorpha subsp. ruderalis]